MKVAVVGAGPGGAAAGYHLARAGHDVRLYDRSTFPRDKTCGDWVTRGALAELEHLALPRSALRAEATQGAEIFENVVSAPNGRVSRVRHAPGDPGACVPRAVFDELLFRRAVAAGCRFEHIAIRDPAVLAGDHDVVVDARGVYAGDANTVALRAYWTVPRARVDEAVARAVHLFTVEQFRMGYGWIFPADLTAERVRVNLGVGIWREEYDARGIKIGEDFDRFVETNPVARRLAAVATERGRTRGHHLALATGPRRVAQAGILRIGDAANSTDPITGEGIANAVLGGRLAAEAIDGARDAGDAERRWQQAFDRRLLPELRAALRVRRMLLGTARKNLAMWCLQRSPRLARWFHGSLEGVASYRGLLASLAGQESGR
jgi:flavin-dependent dehydrogenase